MSSGCPTERSRWPAIPLGDVAIVEREMTDSAAIRSGTKYVGLEHMDGENGTVQSVVVEAGELASTKFAFTPRHVLYGKLRPYLRKVARPEANGVCSTDILPLCPGERIDRDYLFHFLRQPRTVELATSRCSGANLPRLSPRSLLEFLVPLPPRPEQKRIAAILDKADAIRRKRQESIRMADEFMRSAFLDMFGDPVMNPKGWRKAALQTVFSKTREGTKCGPFGSALKKEEITASGVPVWTMYNIVDDRFAEAGCLFISEEKYRELQAYAVTNGEIIISRAGTVGKMCVVETSTPRSIISTNLIRLSLDSTALLPHFFVSLMTYCKGRVGRLKTGDDDAYTYMNTAVLASLTVPVPPLARQQAYVTLLQRARDMASRSQLAGKDADMLFQSLSHRAFAGDL